MTRPKSRSDPFVGAESAAQRARRRWGQGRSVALRAGHDFTSDDEGGDDAVVKRQQKLQREKYAKTMVYITTLESSSSISQLTNTDLRDWSIFSKWLTPNTGMAAI